MKHAKQKGPRYRGPFCLASVMHFYSGQVMENYSGVDAHPRQILSIDEKYELEPASPGRRTSHKRTTYR